MQDLPNSFKFGTKRHKLEEKNQGKSQESATQPDVEGNSNTKWNLHQRMLSRIVQVGYEGLNDEEKAYWNNVY